MRENLAYVVAAYVVMWGALLGYLWRVRKALAQSRLALEHATRDAGARRGAS